MADEIDLANDLIDIELGRALNKLRQQNDHPIQGATFCHECMEELPLARKSLGFKLCVPCAEDAERRKSLFAE